MTFSVFLALGKNEEAKRYYIYRKILDQMETMITQNPEIDMVYIIGDNGRDILSEERYYSPNHPFPKDEIYQQLKEIAPDSGSVAMHSRLSPNGHIIVTLARKIKGRDFKPKGILGVDIAFEDINQFLPVSRVEKKGFFMIVNNDGKIVYHPNQELFGVYISDDLKTELKKK